MLRIGGFTLLTDPNFLHRGQRAYLGKGLWSRRRTEPALQPRQLPRLDAVVLSHLHGDHFDRVSRRELDRAAPVVTTPQAAQQLSRWGFDAAPVDTWQTHRLVKGGETLTLTSVPAIHARGLMGRLLPPVMGTVLEHAVDGELRRRVYVSGDTLTGYHVDDVRERVGGIDTAIVHLGGTRVLFHTVTMDAAQGVDFLQRVQPTERAIAVHFDDYPVFRSPVSRWHHDASRAGFADVVVVPKPGETVTL